MKMFSLERHISIYALTICLATCTPVFAAPCPERITADMWVNSFGGGQQAQRDFFAQLKACLPGDEKKQAAVDTFAVNSLSSLEELPKDDQKALADFVVQALLINARAGFSSSQHNYAALHNAPPGSLLQRLVPQDYAVFIYWTRKAAAQGEPRALFNLATRMADDDPGPGVVQDLPTAYTILAILERLYSKEPDLPAGMMAYVVKTKAKLAKKLGKKRVRHLDTTITTFDFTKLAPPAEMQ